MVGILLVGIPLKKAQETTYLEDDFGCMGLIRV